MDSKEVRESGVKVWNNFKTVMPVLIGVLLLVALFIKAAPKDIFTGLFTGNAFIDPFVGAVFGSILAGNPINSYIIGGELLRNGVSLFAVTAFIVAWVTVGVVQFPAESLMLGKKFAAARNLTSFVLSVVVAVLTVFTLGIFS